MKYDAIELELASIKEDAEDDGDECAKPSSYLPSSHSYQSSYFRIFVIAIAVTVFPTILILLYRFRAQKPQYVDKNSESYKVSVLMEWYRYIFLPFLIYCNRICIRFERLKLPLEAVHHMICGI